MRTIERSAPVDVRPHLSEVRGTEPAYKAYSTLYIGYTVLPIVAGLDKFSHILVDWNQYLAPVVATIVGGEVDAFMKLVGVVEIAAGVLVAVRPRWGAFVVGLWLMGIVGNLLLVPGYFDIALRDFGLALGAFSLWQLSGQYGGGGYIERPLR
jgi:hypothetical protein